MSDGAPESSSPLRSGDDVRDLLRRLSPKPSSAAGATLALYGGVILALLVLPHALGLLVWLGMMGLLVTRARRGHQLSRSVVELRELAIARRNDEAVAAAWRLLPALRAQPQLHVQAALALGAGLARRREHEQALAVYEHLLRFIPRDTPAGHALRIARLIGLLHTDRLTDAADELSRLRTVKLPDTQRAALALASLYQQIKTNHHADAAEEISGESDEATLETLRPLGVDAGYGYALVADAFRATGQDEAARRWWRRATLLMPAPVIVWALPETSALLTLPGAPHPQTLGGSEAR